MKLSNESIIQLEALVATSLIAGIKKLIIEPGKIRGIDDKQNVAIVTSHNVPDFEGKSVGLTRPELLAARLNLVKAAGDPTIEATEAPNNPKDIMLVELSAGKTKAQYRCASTDAVKGVPKTINDNLVWELKVDAKVIPTLSAAATAMGSDTITLASADGKTVTFECVDSNKDVFSTEIDEPAAWIGTDSPGTSFVQKYPTKTLISLLKEASKAGQVTLQIGEGGILSLPVNGFDFFIIPPQ